jgi:hypothetical protein
MRDGLRWTGYLSLVLIVFIVIVFATYRLRGPSRTQRDALAVMQKDYRPAHGRNAFPLLWFMNYAVPDAELDARMQAEIATVSKRLAAGDMRLSYEPDAPKLAEGTTDLSRLCESRAPGCLAKVMADPESMRSALAAFPTTRARDKLFEQTDFYWNDFPADFRFAIASYSGPAAQRIWLGAYALQWVDGDHAKALSNVCRNIGTWRRLHRGTNSSTGAMIAMGNADGGLRLFADMLAALPQGEVVPEACELALHPIEVADVDRCAEMASELAISRSAIRLWPTESSWWDRAQTWVAYEPRQSEAWRAEQDAGYCGVEANRRMLDDRPFTATVTAPVTHRAECVASFAGCVLADIASPVNVEYDARTLDFAAHLRLAATLLWLRDSPADETLVERFDKRPDTLRSGRRNSGIDLRAGVVFTDNLHAKREARFELPAPKGVQ